MTAPELLDQVQRALNEANTRVANYARLVGDIRYQMTANHVSSGGAKVEVLRLLDEFFGVVQAAPEVAVQGGPPPARPAALPPSGDGPGYPAETWMPFGHVVQPEPHPDPAVMDMPEMCSGTYSYASLKTWGNR